MTKSYFTILLLAQVWLRVLKETGILEIPPPQMILQDCMTLRSVQNMLSLFSFHESVFI